MKRVLLLALLLGLVPVASQATAGLIASCKSISVNPSVKKGTVLACLDNKSKVTLQALRGPVLVNVFGSWCAPCQQEIPKFVALYATKKIAIIGVDVEERNAAAGTAFVLKKGITWPILFDATGITKADFGPGVPVTWFLNAQGHVVYEQIGLISSQAQLNAEVSKYLGIKL